MDQFLTEFVYNSEGYVALALRNPANISYLTMGELANWAPPSDVDVYFSPAMRRTKGNLKEDVLGSRALWVDADDLTPPQSTLPPSAVVFSGHGYHLYWFLVDPLDDISELEDLNKIVIADVPTADKACWNCNRILRIPGTLNTKEPDACVQVLLRSFNPTLKYTPKDFNVISQLAKNTRHKIRTGDSRGYKSRSERDWAIVNALVVAGADDGLIYNIFRNQLCGDKFREAPEQYLPHTIDEVRAKPRPGDHKSPRGNNGNRVAGPIETDIVEQDDGYYATARNGLRRVSTFIFRPKVLLDGSAFEAIDALVGDVQASGYTWGDITFSRSAFTSVARLDKETPVAAWQWIGHDDDVRRLLPFLLTQLQEQGLPKVAATPIMGLHKIKGHWLFLGDKMALNGAETFQGYTGPLCWLPSQREHPKLDLRPEITAEELSAVCSAVPKLNHPEAIWPMIGWYAASPLKPWFEEHGYRFPVLNVAGTKGSGKTTLIQRVFMPLMGQTDAKTYDSGTTRFVTLALLGSSNAVPIAFSEFRYELVERFIRFILLAYDTGHDPRGKGDQTTVDYPLSAPFSVDGEDLVEDPAARERLVAVVLHPDAVAEGTECYDTFQSFRNSIPTTFGGYFIQKVLGQAPDLERILSESRQAIFDAFPGRLPDRVRNNYTVTYMGIKLWCAITGHDVPNAGILKVSISTVFDLESGRAKTLADSLIEDLVNAVAQGNAYFNNVYDGASNVLWFQLSPAHAWWLASRRRQGRGALERDAIRSQLKEAPYSVTPQVLNDAWMHGIDLAKAQETGLDVPSRFNETTYVVRL